MICYTVSDGCMTPLAPPPETMTQPASATFSSNSTNSHEFHQRQPLLQESRNNDGWDDSGNSSSGHFKMSKQTERNGSIVRIKLPPVGRSGSGESILSSFPEERIKTIVAAGWLTFNFVLSTVSLALTHERVPDPKKANALPDIILDHVTPHEWALTVSEVLLTVSSCITFFIMIVHKHRWIVFRRVFFILGWLYLMRSFTMYVTVLPVASRQYALNVCAPKANNTSPFVIAKRALQLMSGFGLSMNGQHVYCGDYMYSGHTVVLVASYLIIAEYSPKKCIILHWMSLVNSVLGVVMLLISRGHYTVDVVVAYYVTTRLWWMYHTMANNFTLKNYTTYNYFARLWWFPVFRYLEGNILDVVPREYDCPCDCLTKVSRQLFRRRNRI